MFGGFRVGLCPRAVAQLTQQSQFLRHARESGNPVGEKLLMGSRFPGNDDKVFVDNANCISDGSCLLMGCFTMKNN
jgi:hypothetical protein